MFPAQYLQDIYDQLPEPRKIWEYFLNLTQVPRGSNEDGECWRHKQVLAYLEKKAQELGCETQVDKGENLIIRKKATPGCEAKETVCLQCHMDMVCQAADDVKIDFEKDPITPRIDGKYMKATGTTLGADNGIGVAASFAILASTDIKHGPLEVLITRDEETGLYGADALETGILKAKYLINVDNEDENAICIGCAGGFTTTMTMPTIRQKVDGFVVKSVVVRNLKGGHSGCDIHLDRANAIHVMGRLLASLHPCECFRIVSIESGVAHNAIPPRCAVTVAVDATKVKCFEERMQAAFAEWHNEYKSEEDAAFSIVDVAEEKRAPLDLETTARLVQFLNVCPYGPQRFSPVVPNLVETSITCAIAQTPTDDEIVFTASVRSSSKSQIDFMYRKMRCMVAAFGMKVSERMGEYPGWEPNRNSPITKIMEKHYTDVYGTPPEVSACHAGLECGLLMEKYPAFDSCSVGPSVNNPHTPEERILISSVPPFMEVLKRTLESI